MISRTIYRKELIQKINPALLRIGAFSSRGNSSPKAKPTPLNGNLKRKPRLSLVRIRAFSKTSVSVFGISGGLFECETLAVC